jgi:hypothetical protein
MIRLPATAIFAQNDADDERGVFESAASIAAVDGQIEQTAYAAAKGGVVGGACAIWHPIGTIWCAHFRHRAWRLTSAVRVEAWLRSVSAAARQTGRRKIEPWWTGAPRCPACRRALWAPPVGGLYWSNPAGRLPM